MTAIRKNLILRSPQRGRLEGRTAPFPAAANRFISSLAGMTMSDYRKRAGFP
jgi:hypothetical protein